MKKESLFLLLLTFIVACQHKPELATVPASVPVVVNKCDTTNVFYKSNIQPIIKENCYSCHGTSVTQNGGLDLESYTSLNAYLQYGFRGDGIFGSKFYHCISHDQALPMPPTYKLDSCDMAKLRVWIRAGAVDN
jgi:hypothetical protein